MSGLGSAILEETVDGGAVIDNIVSNDGRLIQVPISQIQPNPDQPRQTFNEEEIEGLAQTIKDHGILQPLVVRQEKNRLILIAGERRLRAAKKAGLKAAPVIFRNTEADALEVSIIENVQRSDLHPLELARALKALAEKRDYKQEDLGLIIGKSKGVISRILALNRLPEAVRQKVSTSKLASLDQLYEVATQPTTEKMVDLLERIETGNLTVRETRQHAKKGKPKKGRPGNFSYTHKAPDKSYSITIRFNKAQVNKEELIGAVSETLKSLKGS
jgi:ParB family chromosome partitioning protein